jgi:hypothetical protein
MLRVVNIANSYHPQLVEKHTAPLAMEEQLKPILLDEASSFVTKFWRLLCFESRRAGGPKA